jgi:flagellar protein FlbD
MIKLTHLSGEPFLLNAEWIRSVESRPDTFITLVQGERIVVRETMDDVLVACLEYQRSKQLLPADRQVASGQWSVAGKTAASSALAPSH